jgi:putative membrane protein
MPLTVFQRWLFAAIAFGIPFSAIGALYPGNTWLQVGPVALLLPFAIWAFKRWPISNASAGCIAAFVLLHLVAARWSYSFVPYRDWLPILASASGAERNMFDRLVHFLFGVLAILPFAELAMRHGGVRLRLALVGALGFILAVGGLYEIFEWALTFTLAPEDAGAYNGEQGDVFDSQKDMALAALGSLLAVIPAGRWLKRRGFTHHNR